MMQSARGRLLLATPLLGDPNFERAVVYLLEHNEEGALGVILNRPSDTLVETHLPILDPLVSEPRCFFTGGPVQLDSLIGITRLEGVNELVQPMAGNVGVVDLDALLSRPQELPGLRLYAGYAGWGARQLDHELELDAWFVVDALDGDLFGDTPGDLWRTVLARQPNRLRELHLFPDDVLMN